MQRLLSLGREWLPVSCATLLWVTMASGTSAQTTQSNPLRSAAKPARTTAASTAAPVGTAVRTAKRTPIPSGGPAQVSATTRAPNHQRVAPAAYRSRATRSGSRTMSSQQAFSESSVLQGTVTVQRDGEVLQGETIYEGDFGTGGEMIAGELVESEYLGDDCCGTCNGGGCGDCCLIPCPRIPWDDLTIFGGVQGFTGPKNLGQAGSFGFHEGFNWGAPVPCFNGCLGMQIGARFTQDNLSGTSYSPETRHQTFITAGLFRRVDWGLQGGIVFDYMSDNWYTNTELTQVRAEVSWVLPCSHELGFWMATATSEDSQSTRVFVNQVPVDGNATWEATDLYAFFYRHHLIGWEGASARLFAGFTGDSDGFIGSDVQVPLTCDLALQAGFAYLVPEEAKGPNDIGNSEEAWNVGISLVWYPGCGTANSKSYFAPLFNVADNGSFMVDRID